MIVPRGEKRLICIRCGCRCHVRIALLCRQCHKTVGRNMAMFNPRKRSKKKLGRYHAWDGRTGTRDEKCVLCGQTRREVQKGLRTLPCPKGLVKKTDELPSNTYASKRVKCVDCGLTTTVDARARKARCGLCAEALRAKAYRKTSATLVETCKKCGLIVGKGGCKACSSKVENPTGLPDAYFESIVENAKNIEI